MHLVFEDWLQGAVYMLDETLSGLFELESFSNVELFLKIVKANVPNILSWVIKISSWIINDFESKKKIIII